MRGLVQSIALGAALVALALGVVVTLSFLAALGLAVFRPHVETVRSAEPDGSQLSPSLANTS